MQLSHLAKTIAASASLLAKNDPTTKPISPKISRDIQAAAGSNGHVNTVIVGDTVVMYGHVENAKRMEKIENVARANGAEKVINSVQFAQA